MFTGFVAIFIFPTVKDGTITLHKAYLQALPLHFSFPQQYWSVLRLRSEAILGEDAGCSDRLSDRYALQNPDTSFLRQAASAERMPDYPVCTDCKDM